MGKRRPLWLGAAIVAISFTGEAAAAVWQPPSVDALADDDWGRTVRRGRDMTVDTPKLIGPEVADPARRFAGNNLACQSCHVSAGAAEFGLPFVGVYGDFPQYRGREGRVGTLEDRINGCMTRSMNGRALPVDGAEMRAFVSYIKFLSTGVPVGAATPGRGSGAMPLPDRAADPQRGAVVYAQNCSTCHGANGAGQRAGTPGDAGGYAFPPLWGEDSFNDGAGMARLIAAANFIHSNMPAGTTWQQPSLTVDDSWDVAAYVESQPRPHMPGLDRDYPDRAQKPVDAPYPPYAAGFDELQHRYGPFPPILAALHRPPVPDDLDGPGDAAAVDTGDRVKPMK